jgi:hypothetical protein
MRKIILGVAAAAATLSALPAAADPPPWAPAHGYREHQYERQQERYYRTGNGIQYWRGDDGRYYCHRSNGTTGLIVGAAAGALLGNSVTSHRDRTAGTVIGGAVGALLGQQIARGQVSCR